MRSAAGVAIGPGCDSLPQARRWLSCVRRPLGVRVLVVEVHVVRPLVYRRARLSVAGASVPMRPRRRVGRRRERLLREPARRGVRRARRRPARRTSACVNIARRQATRRGPGPRSRGLSALRRSSFGQRGHAGSTGRCSVVAPRRSAHGPAAYRGTPRCQLAPDPDNDATRVTPAPVPAGRVRSAHALPLSSSAVGRAVVLRVHC